MPLKLSAPISIARGVLSDRHPDYRYEQSDLLEYGNASIRTIATLAPRYLYTEGEVACIPGSALQAVPRADAHSVVEIKRIKGGNIITRCDKKSLDAFDPGWMGATAGPAVNWMPHADDPVSFYITPPAPSGQILEVTFVRMPEVFTEDTDTGLPDTLTDAIADYIIGMAESRDDDHVNSGRAAQFMAQFATRLGVTMNQQGPQK